MEYDKIEQESIEIEKRISMLKQKGCELYKGLRQQKHSEGYKQALFNAQKSLQARESTTHIETYVQQQNYVGVRHFNITQNQDIIKKLDIGRQTKEMIGRIAHVKEQNFQNASDKENIQMRFNRLSHSRQNSLGSDMNSRTTKYPDSKYFDMDESLPSQWPHGDQNKLKNRQVNNHVEHTRYQNGSHQRYNGEEQDMGVRYSYNH